MGILEHSIFLREVFERDFFFLVSVVFPLAAVKAGRGMGMRYRARLGEMKSLVLESVYGLRDIQIFGFGMSAPPGITAAVRVS